MTHEHDHAKDRETARSEGLLNREATASRKRLTKKLTVIIVVVLASLSLIVVNEVDERSRIGQTESLIDPCGGLQINLLSDSCKARTCTRLHSVGATGKWLYENFPDCKRLLRAAEAGRILAPDAAVIRPDTPGPND